jgi:hypothetical protein
MATQAVCNRLLIVFTSSEFALPPLRSDGRGEGLVRSVLSAGVGATGAGGLSGMGAGADALFFLCPFFFLCFPFEGLGAGGSVAGAGATTGVTAGGLTGGATGTGACGGNAGGSVGATAGGGVTGATAGGGVAGGGDTGGGTAGG